MSYKSGYFLAFRSIWNHPAFKNHIERGVWLYMVSNASHKDKELKFMENPVFVKRGELIFPIRKNAKIWKMAYSSMRSFILRLKRKKMIDVRVATTKPDHNHPYKSVSIISIVNYDKFQQYDLTPDQYKTTSSALLSNNLNNETNIIGSATGGDKGYKVISEWGHEQIIIRNGKKYRKHKWKDIPEVEI
tara:strand:+ start:388 stop:954 length:567 start_codon:yes stop_codon:yes gene_type:complete